MSDVRYSASEAFPVKLVGDSDAVLETVTQVPARERVVGGPSGRNAVEDVNVIFVTKSYVGGVTVLTDVDTGTEYRPTSFGAVLVEPIA